MSEISAALREIRALTRAAELAELRLFDPHLEPLLHLLEQDVDHLIGRSLDHIEATQPRPLE